MAKVSSLLRGDHLVAVVWRAIAVLLDVVADISIPYAVVFGESVAVLAFGFSWLLKGSELLTMALNERGIPVWQSNPGSYR